MKTSPPQAERESVNACTKWKTRSDRKKNKQEQALKIVMDMYPADITSTLNNSKSESAATRVAQLPELENAEVSQVEVHGETSERTAINVGQGNKHVYSALALFGL